MYICSRCKKGVQVGMNVSHSHIRTKKRSLPNLHVFKLTKAGRTASAYFCTKCLRVVKNEMQVKGATKNQTEVKESTEDLAQLPI
ncbi:MAG: hypothetical protein A3A57_00550 [Candidatus Woykebacteria bacterium RIFCSPLOWO2_01_FULL_41_12]|uniref:50S ribosomal protein L28 n=1 Tax=Candidatus Woykebacteria bacterium RIFCSPLOWO2_01_FULL_41_12 TaxID=1802604 RepID=A0A1G1WXE2_9BACT|nr:MAG: hypothetical protein A3A57_00550 [Candidatus Woykebacteria bacterium RIFCSPLOWO2_01_FULL_41_12]